ncbi:MAG: hypothetical protein ABIL18_05125, partial [candidate division WOR-3 bacterium]
PLSRTSIALLDTIKNNRVLAVLADRDIKRQGKVLGIFTGKRSFPNLGAIIVKRKLPVVFGYMVLSNKKRYLGVVEPVHEFKSENDFYQYMIERFENVIRKYPDQWFVFHPEWVE